MKVQKIIEPKKCMKKKCSEKIQNNKKKMTIKILTPKNCHTKLINY